MIFYEHSVFFFLFFEGNTVKCVENVLFEQFSN